MRLEPLAQILADAGVGVIGATIFVYHMPENVTDGVLLRQPLQGTEIDYELPGYVKTDFQLIVRSSTYADGFDLVERATQALTFEHVTTLADRQINYQRPRTEPIVYPRSDANVIEMSVNFECSFVRIT